MNGIFKILFTCYQGLAFQTIIAKNWKVITKSFGIEPISIGITRLRNAKKKKGKGKDEIFTLSGT